MIIALVYAMSLDGKLSTVDGAGPRFTSSADRRHLQRLRAEADAVLLGAGTVAADDPPFRLPRPLQEARRSSGRPPTPIRVVLSGRGSVSPKARLFFGHQSPAVVLTSDAVPPERFQALQTVAEVHQCGSSGRVDLETALNLLAERYGVQRLLVEGGGTVNFAFLAADRVDEVYATLSPVLIGGREVPTPVDGPGLPFAQIRRFHLVSLRWEEGELFLHYRREGASRPV
ncbi:MAG: diaminohydroxyphosphoribosylaminopyrimidine reductase [Candidatus Poribacteria bacterium]|nr:MAG: diaminohydroxyphosphoribosylaminopyrimidine reductase [Candidatus Poribacteria bacterium]